VRDGAWESQAETGRAASLSKQPAGSCITVGCLSSFNRRRPLDNWSDSEQWHLGAGHAHARDNRRELYRWKRGCWRNSGQRRRDRHGGSVGGSSGASSTGGGGITGSGGGGPGGTMSSGGASGAAGTMRSGGASGTSASMVGGVIAASGGSGAGGATAAGGSTSSPGGAIGNGGASASGGTNGSGAGGGTSGTMAQGGVTGVGGSNAGGGITGTGGTVASSQNGSSVAAGEAGHGRPVVRAVWAMPTTITERGCCCWLPLWLRQPDGATPGGEAALRGRLKRLRACPDWPRDVPSK